MEADGDNEALKKIASGAQVSAGSWPGLRDDILDRLDKIARDAFPIPTLPPPGPRPRLLSPLASSPPPEHPAPGEAGGESATAAAAAAVETAAPDELLPPQIADQLGGIKAKLATFAADAPHTIQRLAELVLEPRAHYRALATYLHAVDRVVQVTSGTAVYPLPPAVPDMSALNGGCGSSSGCGGSGGGGSGDEAKDPAATVAWSNPTTAPLGSDEALGGALLTPIPWLTRSPESNGDGPGAHIHSEGTETIQGPNGVGSIETVSVSVNGVPSTGHARGVTQGELLRQEQRAGVIPVSQLSRGQDGQGDEDRGLDDERAGGPDGPDGADDAVDGGGGGAANDGEDAETPHARGPEEIGVDDTGLQGVPLSYFGQDGMQMQDIDAEAAVGRRHDDEGAPPQPAPAPASGTDAPDNDAPDNNDAATAEGSRAKREAETGLEAEAPKKAKESDGDAAVAATDPDSRASPQPPDGCPRRGRARNA